MTEVPCVKCNGSGEVVEPILDDNGKDIIWQALVCDECGGHGTWESI